MRGLCIFNETTGVDLRGGVPEFNSVGLSGSNGALLCSDIRTSINESTYLYWHTKT